MGPHCSSCTSVSLLNLLHLFQTLWKTDPNPTYPKAILSPYSVLIASLPFFKPLPTATDIHLDEYFSTIASPMRAGTASGLFVLTRHMGYMPCKIGQ